VRRVKPAAYNGVGIKLALIHRSEIGKEAAGRGKNNDDIEMSFIYWP
jgi:hypothetical protein